MGSHPDNNTSSSQQEQQQHTTGGVSLPQTFKLGLSQIAEEEPHSSTDLAQIAEEPSPSPTGLAQISEDPKPSTDGGVLQVPKEPAWMSLLSNPRVSKCVLVTH